MEHIIYMTRLFDLYGALLTEQEIEVFSLYYEENLSMQEIADIKEISKARVGVILKTVDKKLSDFESKLNFKNKADSILELVKGHENIKEAVEEILTH